MSVADKYREQVGKKFGKLTFVELEVFLSEKNRENCRLHFVCECGAKKIFVSGRASKVFLGETVSCGCFKKARWAKEFHTWKHDWSRKYAT